MLISLSNIVLKRVKHSKINSNVERYIYEEKYESIKEKFFDLFPDYVIYISIRSGVNMGWFFVH